MKSKLQLSPETRIGDWFLYKHHTVIKDYYFSEAPYLIPPFLTPRLFSLEFIMKKLYFEIEHFLNHKKVSNLKFPFNVGPFIVKTKSTLHIIERFLKVMGFKEVEKIRYGPHQIICHRKKKNKSAPFENQTIEGMDKISNLESFQEYEHGSQSDAIQKNPRNLVVPTPQKVDLENKRVISDVTDMEI